MAGSSLAWALVDAGLRGVAIALLVLLAAALQRDRPHLALTRVGTVFAAGLVVQIIGSTPFFEAEVPRLWQVPWIAVAVGNAVLFWVFVQALFDDEFALTPWHVGAWLGAVAIVAATCLAGRDPATTTARLLAGAQRSVPLVFSLLAVLAAASSWRLDLVEKRRRLRAFIVIGGVAYTLVMVAVRMSSPQGRVLGAAATLDVAALLLMTAVTSFGLLRVVQTDFFPSPAACPDALAGLPAGAAAPAPQPATQAAPPLPPPDADDARLATLLQQEMEGEHAYRAEGLTVASLAGRLRVPEYRLRRHINQRLGHRNFNAYVNAYRLAEARRALADPALNARPVLTIALEAGFQSIGPFNRAFKAATGLTPTDFRRLNTSA